MPKFQSLFSPFFSHLGFASHNFYHILSNVLYTKNIFLNIIMRWRAGPKCSDTTINLCGNILTNSVKMHFSGNTEILGF